MASFGCGLLKANITKAKDYDKKRTTGRFFKNKMMILFKRRNR
jgi:hypothetical protein